MNTDAFLVKCYQKERYNCLHFSRDIWLELTGVDITERLQGLLGDASARKVGRGHFRAFTRLQARVDPCLVYMRQLGKDPHLGVFVDGGVLHMRPNGPEFFPFDLATRGFTSFRYYQ